MIFKNEKIEYEIRGLNLKKFILMLRQQNVEVFNFYRIDYNHFIIRINYKDEKIFLRVCKKLNYSPLKLKSTKLLNFKDLFKRNIALMLSIVFVFFILFISNYFVFQIQVYGIKSLSYNQIIKVLNNNKIVVGKLKSFYNLDDIEIVLKENLNKISFASAVIKGNTLILNVSEKIDNDEFVYDFEPQTSPYDCIILSINLISGTPLVSVGQTVKKDQIIVMPHIIDNSGNLQKVPARAEIEAYIEISNTLVYSENHIKKVRSGRKKVKTEYDFLGLSLGARIPGDIFFEYEIEKKEIYYFKNLLLPIKTIKTYYFELKDKQVFEPFLSQKEILIEQNKKIVYNKLLNKNLENVVFDSTINFDANVYFLTTYLKANIKF